MRGGLRQGRSRWWGVSQVAAVGIARTCSTEIMQEPFTRDRIIEALQAMPPEATIDDAIERLVFLAKIEAGLAEVDRSEGVPHDAARRDFGL